MTIEITQDLEATECCSCGVLFMVPTILLNHARKNGGFIHCPNGHSIGWSQGKLETVTITSLKGNFCKLKYSDELIEFETAPGEKYHNMLVGRNYVQVLHIRTRLPDNPSIRPAPFR